MDSKTLLLAFVCVPLILFAILMFFYVSLQRRNRTNKSAVLQKMMNEALSSSSGKEAFYQKVYVKIDRVPILNRYLRKIRRRLELVNQNDEYSIRKESAKIALKSIFYTLIASIIIGWINKDDMFIMLVSLLGVLIIIENLTEQMINKVENRLLVQELEFFSEVRHAYHSTNMVEEAVYDASLMEEQEIISQANTIYEILISADPEMELEKYYDVAPNRFLKIFAGVTYLTKEFGDRKIGGISLYLKDLNNITQELQLEILKRDKLDYMFKSLTYIAVAPVLLIHPLRDWALDTFASTSSFYNGKLGFLMEIVLLVLTFLSYSLIIRIKDNDEKQKIFSSDMAWQERVYRLPFVERIIDGLVPNQEKPAYARVTHLLKETASTLKVEWLYVNKAICAVVGFAVTILIINQMHSMAVESVLYDDTTESNMMGKMSEKDLKVAQSLTASDRYFLTNFLENDEILNAVKNKPKEEAIQIIERNIMILSSAELSETLAEDYSNKIYKGIRSINNINLSNAKADIQDAILKAGIEMPRNNFVVNLSENIIANAKAEQRINLAYEDVYNAVLDIYSVELTSDEIISYADRVYEKLTKLTSEYFKWMEFVAAILVALFTYSFPNMLLSFQKRMRQMEMDDEVMQFQTIILMLMYIERVSVEYILEWLTRFSNIFREPLQRCLNNYESGAYEALEQLKDEVTYKPFIRIVESLQSAVENVKITDAFDELETERAFFQEKRKESNERLINRKAKIGKVIGFAPMVVLFVGYLIVPLMWTSIADMGVYFTQMGSMM